MSHKTHFDPGTAWGIFSKIFSAAHIKAVVATCGLALSWVFEGESQVLISVYLLLIIDTITGLAYAGKTKQISSRGFYRVAIKCMVYFVMIVVSRIVDKHVPIAFAAPIMDSFLVMTEALSILENLSKCGFPVPTKLVKLLQIYWDKK